MAEIEDRGSICDCGLREANTALRQRVAELTSERDAAIREIVRWAIRAGGAESALRSAGLMLADTQGAPGAEATLRESEPQSRGPDA